ncbi:tetratricopeptide repeat protein [Chryseobacterium caseinilyticum]|uniref:HTH luxR-type domain-containing protein n=1 Tax=Chryseobacterium caseinilyticum TaxID=2771428 RepID=A0ABR8Z7U7_9FLAO|nr:hypothetical protein [Chryseobacterium caseinilyticum]MBD8081368.1 hypothetical protein [Chryseobacterium caseinilyticum]
MNFSQAIKILFFSGCFLLLSGVMLGQNKNAAKELDRRLDENAKLYRNNIDQAFQQLPELLRLSKTLNDGKAEMKILDRKCRYFYSKNLTDSLIVEAEKLKKVSANLQDYYFESMAHVYLAETYSINNLPDLAITNLNNAYELLEKADQKSEKVFFAKANVLSSFANIYLDKKQPKEAAKKILQVIENGNQIEDEDKRNAFQYLNYSNIANIYLQVDIDSAKMFADKSFAIRPQQEADNRNLITNYTVFGNYFEKKEDFKSAIYYFHKALKINKSNGTDLNLNEIYLPLQRIYSALNQKDSAEFYHTKAETYDLKIMNSKYNSLQKVLSKEKDQQNKSPMYFLYITLGMGILSAFGIYYFTKKRKSAPIHLGETKQEKTGPSTEIIQQLIELLEKNDPSFLINFEIAFPDFISNLSKKYPELQPSEREFCAMLKLKLSTKEIAKYTFIETRTVQNKKYRLRKKFEIPQEVDIYYYIDQI